MLIIEPSNPIQATTEELLSTTDQDLAEFRKMVDTLDVRSGSLAVQSGVFNFDGKSLVEFTEYRAITVASYRDRDGDMWWVTGEGARINMSRLATQFEQEVHNARRNAE